MITVDLEDNEVVYTQESAINCTNGFLQFSGNVCFRSEISGNICCDVCSKALLQKLEACGEIEEIVSVLDDLVGGWSLLYYRADLSRFFIGRDAFGRKSLLWTRTNNKFSFSCFTYEPKCDWHDVPAGTVTVVDMRDREANRLFYIFDAGELWALQFSKLEKIQKKMALKRLIPSYEQAEEQVCRQTVAAAMLEQLRGAVHRTLSDVSRHTEFISVSFSGGIDSLLLAHIIAQCLPPNKYEEAPDRPQSIKAYKFLKYRYPERRFHLCLVNVDLNELAECRKKYIASALAPASSVLDDSVGCAQSSEAKIVVAGSGADELFGGYMRHRATYLKKGRKAVLDELCQELQRIGGRNLGCHFSMICTWNGWLLCHWNAKQILLSREGLLLGTPDVLCTTPKRAMQFGTKIAKLENKREKGDDPCVRLL
ncbi:unnamed protein product [Gongylonema pulchrum]|uniref:Asparagine synthetase domain-containing protein 1 n=1 Tax=Gongylonema pulchrum TaxID=637853 RepID=A0A183EAI0_9BILA|nr:unnamed protein product [Gongylonema pulchrum]